MNNLNTEQHLSIADRGSAESHRHGLVRAQAVIREVNEQIHELNGRFDGLDVRTIICECSREDCMTQIEITPEVYDQVRAFPTRFILVPGHLTPSVERVVETHDGYVIAETVGSGAQTAIRLDPRRQQ